MSQAYFYSERSFRIMNRHICVLKIEKESTVMSCSIHSGKTLESIFTAATINMPFFATKVIVWSKRT